MARARKDFTEEEMAILKTSPHVMDSLMRLIPQLRASVRYASNLGVHQSR